MVTWYVSPLAQVMACCLTTPIRYINQCGLIISEVLWHSPGPRFNIKMTSYQYRKSHCGDKTAVRSSYLYNGISYTGKMTSLYWIRAVGAISQWVPNLLFCILSLKSIILKLQPHPPGTNELIGYILVTYTVHTKNNARNPWFVVFYCVWM